MSLKLYKLDLSPPARAAMMACGVNNVPVEMIDVDLFQGDHLKPEYLKKNPLHTVPTLEDGDLILHDSHAIIMYLTEKYGNDDTLFPKDIKQRALINQKLLFNSAILFTRLRSITFAAIMQGVRNPTDKQLDDIREAYGFLEEFLSRTKYLALDHLTIADIAAVATVTSLFVIIPLDNKKYPKIAAWVNAIEKLPFVQKYNKPGNELFAQMVKKYVDI